MLKVTHLLVLPAYYTSDETEKRDNSCAFTSSDVECFKIEEKKKKKVLRKRRRQKFKMVNSLLETVKEETITVRLSCPQYVERMSSQF